MSSQTNSLDIIDQLPYELAARLECDPFFDDIPIVVFEAGDVSHELQQKQGIIKGKSGKYGAAVFVLQIVAEDPFKNIQFSPMQLFPAFQTVENVELNKGKSGTGKSHRRIARRIRDVIKNCVFAGLVQDMKAAKPCIEPVDLSDLGPTIKGSQVNFDCLEVSGETQTLVQMPVYSGDGTRYLVLTCPTPGAEIWFTVDGSYPYWGDKDKFPKSTAELYTGPIALEVGATVVRACAYLDEPGAVASGINNKTIIAE